MNFIPRITESDLRQIVEIDHEAFSSYGTVQEQQIFAKRLKAFAEGFIVVEFDDQVIRYGASERWLEEREPAINEDSLLTHHWQGRIFCITGMAARKTFR